MIEGKKKVLLTQIVNDKFSVGAFSGMIFNAQLQHTDMKVEELIDKALEVRIKMKELAMVSVVEGKAPLPGGM